MADNHCALIDCTEPDFMAATLMCGHPFGFCELHGKQFYFYAEQGHVGACPACGAPIIGAMIQFESMQPTP